MVWGKLARKGVFLRFGDGKRHKVFLPLLVLFQYTALPVERFSHPPKYQIQQMIGRSAVAYVTRIRLSNLSERERWSKRVCERMELWDNSFVHNRNDARLETPSSGTLP